MKFDVFLLEKSIPDGLTKSEVMNMFDSLNDEEAYPVEIENLNGESTAMGFITASGAEKIDYDYDGTFSKTEGLNQFIGNILADMKLESANGIYSFKGLLIFLSR